MAEKNIDNAEVMTEEQLDQVAGGTNTESFQLKSKIKSVGGIEYFWQIKEWLNKNLSIEAKLNLGFPDEGEPNVYSERIDLGGGLTVFKPLTHEQVLQKIEDWGKAHKK